MATSGGQGYERPGEALASLARLLAAIRASEFSVDTSIAVVEKR